MSAILNPRTGRPATAGPPELLLPPAVAAARQAETPVFAANDLRSTRDWQSLFTKMQSRVKENFLSAFSEVTREAMSRRLGWQVHMVTFDELGKKLGDDLEIRGNNVFLYGWPLDVSAILLPGAVRVVFIVLAERSTPGFVEHLAKLRASQADTVGTYSNEPVKTEPPDANAP